jgi:hypothetical protein
MVHTHPSPSPFFLKGTKNKGMKSFLLSLQLLKFGYELRRELKKRR